MPTSTCRPASHGTPLSSLSTLVPLLLLALFLAPTTPATARNFSLTEDLSGASFFDAFTWWSYPDPTQGAVNYVSQSEARASNLSYVNAQGHFVLQADSTAVVPSGEARRSVRIQSRRVMGDGVLVAKLAWMPQGCATWPALWTCTRGDWPAGGEIDIVEGANDQGPRNLASLHTSYGCHIQTGTSSDRTGTSYQGDCSYQPGCSVQFNGDNSFGPDFNRNGGGYYAMRRDTQAGGDGISVWFWPASTPASSLPQAVSAAADGSAPKYVVTGSNATGSDRSELDKWGTPAAFFPNIANASASTDALAGGADAVCQMDRFFGDHEVIINLTFCGYWAGATFGSSGCAARSGNLSCEQFVRENPEAFRDARWEVEYMRMYTDASSTLSARSAWILPLAIGVVTLILFC